MKSHNQTVLHSFGKAHHTAGMARQQTRIQKIFKRMHFGIYFRIHFRIHSRIHFRIHFRIHLRTHPRIHFSIHFKIHFRIHQDEQGTPHPVSASSLAILGPA